MSCAKCRQSPPSGSDSWCIGCTALESLQSELGCSWHVPALRAIANNLVVSAVRGVTALRETSCSFRSAGDARAASALRDPPREATPADRPPLQRDPGRRDRSAKTVKAPVESSEEESIEEEEEEPESATVGAVPKSAPVRRPPEPQYPPRQHHSHHHHHQQDDREELRRIENKRKRSRDRKEGERKREKKKTHRGNRGGSKHPRLYRTLEDPNLRVHRRAQPAVWKGARSLAGPRPEEGPSRHGSYRR